MNELLYALVASFKTIVKWKISKTALISGFIFMSIWVVIGFVFWHPLTSFTISLLNFVPFAFIKSNGAFMLSSLIFVQSILITLAFVIIILSTTIIKDAKEKKFPLFILSIAFGVILFWSVVWFFNHGIIYTNLEKILTWLPFHTIEKAMAYIYAIYLLYSLYVVSLLLFVSIFSKKILRLGIEDRIEKKADKNILIFTLKDTAIFLVISVIAFPLFFIPVVNFLFQILIWIWLIKDTFTYDIGAIFYDNDKIKEIKQKHKKTILTISFISSLFNFIPILNIFSPYFGEFAMYYYFETYEENTNKY